jgi:hypothetical protein
MSQNASAREDTGDTLNSEQTTNLCNSHNEQAKMEKDVCEL